MENIKRIFTENVGGGNWVDFLELPDGRIVGINDEFIVLYENMDDFWEARPDRNYQAISLGGDTYKDD